MMKIACAALLVVLGATPALGQHDANTTPRVGLMSAEVLQRRFELLGYAQVRVTMNGGREARISAMKDGRAVELMADRALWAMPLPGAPLSTMVQPAAVAE